MFLGAITAAIAVAVLLSAVIAGIVALVCAPVLALVMSITNGRPLGVSESNDRPRWALRRHPVSFPAS